MSWQKKRERDAVDCILFLGNRSDVERLYQAMDIFVFPSRVEGFGIAAIEAQAASVQVIASTELPEDVEMTPYIHRIPLQESAEEWSQAVLACKMQRKDDSPSMLREKGFDIKEQAGKMQDFYVRLIKEMC